MRELALNILDIAQNSVKAGACQVDIAITLDGNRLIVEIADDGKGMDAEFLKNVTDPFTTTRTTRKVGMGIPLYKMGAELAGGTFDIRSQLLVGTTVKTTYQIDHVDRPPLGNIAETVVSLILGAPQLDYTLRYTANGNSFVFETKEFRNLFGEIPLETYEVLQYIKKHIDEEIKSINGGIEI